MKLLITVALTLFYTLSISAQGIKAQYVFKVKATNAVSVETYLFDGQKSLLYYGDDVVVREPVTEVKDENGVTTSYKVELQPDAKDDLVAYADYTAKQWVAKAPIGDELFLATDQIPVLIWKFTNQKKVIADHPCYAATTNFKGRNYTAWFATDIPVSAGPYKFSGLPGLILEIQTNDGLFAWYCKSISRLTAPESELIKKPYAKRSVSFEEFMNMHFAFAKTRLEMMGTYDGVTVEDDFTINPDTLIELPE